MTPSRLGQASDLAKPGGFRRAYVIANDLSTSSSTPELRRREYAARSLTEHLQRRGGSPWRAFVTDLTLTLTPHPNPSP